MPAEAFETMAEYNAYMHGQLNAIHRGYTDLESAADGPADDEYGNYDPLVPFFEKMTGPGQHVDEGRRLCNW